MFAIFAAKADHLVIDIATAPPSQGAIDCCAAASKRAAERIHFPGMVLYLLGLALGVFFIYGFPGITASPPPWSTLITMAAWLMLVLLLAYGGVLLTERAKNLELEAKKWQPITADRCVDLLRWCAVDQAIDHYRRAVIQQHRELTLAEIEVMAERMRQYDAMQQEQERQQACRSIYQINGA